MNNSRYSELDWLRVALIFAVFLHHVFMPFNGDGWHVMNNDSSKALDDIMVYFEQLRLQTLFFIAGAGSLLLLQRASAKTFLLSKFHRLFIPFLVGMLFIIPPQTYYEHINQYDSLLAAYQQRILSFETNHLWFIEFLIVFMLLAVPINIFLKGKAGAALLDSLNRLANLRHGLFSLALLAVLLRCTAKYLAPSESHTIENVSVSLFFLFFFVAGMCFMKNRNIWQAIARHRAVNLVWFIASSVLFYAYYYSPDLSAYLSLDMQWAIWWGVCTLVSWSGLLVLVGYASTYCTTTPKWLVSTNELIYPFYILHQTAIVIVAFYIVQWDAGIAVKSVSVLVSSLAVCSAICYFIIKPFDIIRYLFGLKPKPKGSDKGTQQRASTTADCDA